MLPPRRTAVLCLALPLCAQQKDDHPPMYVAPASAEARQQIATFRLEPGLRCELVAAEPQLANPVAFAVDGQGRIFVAETFRINDGVFDTRNYMQWKDADLACRTVADRVAKYHRFLADELPRYAAYSERVQLLVDDDRDGVVDRSTVFADGFDDLACGILAGVLPHDGSVYVTNIPNLWQLRDGDGDGVADQRTALASGFGVHTSLIGHDLHGLIVGPDRRLYFSIGDRGLHVEQGDRTLDFPDEGAVLRCELDGSRLEVVHRGLRNPQELAFDQYGDLFTGDNNSDGGDRARFVHVVEGGDSGWRIGFQWLDDRGAWNRERLWQPRFPGQAAWILPPIVNLCDGPSGLVYDPGVGLPERYRDCFFLCDFRGGSSQSGVQALRLVPRGAEHELAATARPIWSVLCTDVDFAPDGSLLLSDWVDGWNKTGKGRIYRVRTAAMADDLQLRTLARLLASDFGSRTPAQLQVLLGHQDRRVRQQAEFALIDQAAAATLLAAARDRDHRLARLHGIWGLGVLGRRDAAAVTPLLPLLADDDAEVRAQAAKVLGDVRCAAAGRRLVDALGDSSSRVRFHAALALGRLGAAAPARTAAALVALLRRNADRDVCLRHAAALALARLGDREALLAALADADAPVRLGALLALRRLGDGAVAGLLADPEPALRTEAARAIYDQPIAAALPALAARIDAPLADDALAWRVLNAHRRLGAAGNGEALIAFALDAARPAAQRLEALQILGEWSEPHGQDRISGLWRPVQHADAAAVAAALPPALVQLLAGDGELAAAAAELAGRLRADAAVPALQTLVRDRDRGSDARCAALAALGGFGDAALAVVDGIGADDPVPLRQLAVRIFAERRPQQAVPVLATLLDNGSVGEQQAALAALGRLQHAAATALLRQWLDRLPRGEVPAALQLDLLEAAAAHAALQPQLAARQQALPKDDPLAAWRECLAGGDARRGRRLFLDFEPSRCTRCHSVGGHGGNAGPALDGVGRRRTPEYLLQALVEPSATICEGFASTVLQLHDGDTVAGLVVKDQDGVVEVMDVDGNLTTVPQDRIKSRSGSTTSAMPKMAGVLDRRQLRDVLAFLQGLQQEPAK